MAELYADNKILNPLIIKYKLDFYNCKDNALPRPTMSTELAEYILLIVKGLSRSKCFINYTWLDEMVSDAIENCIKYIHNYNEEKYNSGYTYISMIARHAFIQRIHKEKKQQYIKLTLMESKGIFGFCQDFDRSKYESEAKTMGLSKKDLLKFADGFVKIPKRTWRTRSHIVDM